MRQVRQPAGCLCRGCSQFTISIAIEKRLAIGRGPYTSYGDGINDLTRERHHAIGTIRLTGKCCNTVSFDIGLSSALAQGHTLAIVERIRGKGCRVILNIWPSESLGGRPNV
jgi:hypothetical protein